MKQNLFKIVLMVSSLLFLTGCISTKSQQLIGTTWIGDYERYRAEKKHPPNLLQHGVIRLEFGQDSLTQCNIERPTNDPMSNCQYLRVEYKQDTLFFLDYKEYLVLRKRTKDYLELENTKRKRVSYLKIYKENKAR
ncbi:MAG: Unknown protein [uncultured Aureispira sp.]|uniref:Lipoprotein n=1 Tax=uncultured Aureispira sp. TaxID=1331704 RepID=A0A6S6UCS5_9BACT|nr:MAG: Unknown protein [uncultured Aureispira sp.]